MLYDCCMQLRLGQHERERHLQAAMSIILRSILWYLLAVLLCAPSPRITILALSFWPPANSTSAPEAIQTILKG